MRRFSFPREPHSFAHLKEDLLLAKASTPDDAAGGTDLDADPFLAQRFVRNVFLTP